MEYKINDRERDALRGLPYIQRLLYYEGIRPYMDYSTGIVGIKRGISLQSLTEELYIDVHQGYKSGSPSRDQIRRGLKGLVKAGLVQSIKSPRKLIFKCLLASQDNFIQNKLATKAPQQGTTIWEAKKNQLTSNYISDDEKATKSVISKGATPPESGINIIFLQKTFSIFWKEYPVKKSKQKTWEIYCQLNPSPQLFETIMRGLESQLYFYQQQKVQGHWVAAWKYPSNWLSQQCWEDEVNLEIRGNCSDGKNSKDTMWESCKAGFMRSANEKNIIDITKKFLERK